MAAAGAGGEGGRHRAGRLAELLEIEPISVSRLLDRMEEGGWIERRQDAGDRRVRMIFPTDKSRQAFAAIKSVAGDVYDAALAGLTADEKRALVKGLTAIITNLSDGEIPSGRTSRHFKRQCSMNAVAKVKDDVTKVELRKSCRAAGREPANRSTAD